MKNIISKEEIFNRIAEASVMNGNLGLFIGAGFSMAVFDDESKELINSQIRSKPLSWKELLKQICVKLEIDFNSISKEYMSCPEIASEICKKLSDGKSISFDEAQAILKQIICQLVSWYPNKDQRNVFADQIKNLSPDWIITTNYDLIIEGLLPDQAKPIKPNEVLSCSRKQIPVYHMHGIKTDPNSIVITNEDYIKLFRPDEYRQQRLPFLLMESTTLTIGYGVGDSNVLTALDWKNHVYKDSVNSSRGYFIQLVYTKKTDSSAYEDNGIIVLETNSILKTLKEINSVIDKKKKERASFDATVEKFVTYYESLDQAGLDNFIDDDSQKDLFVKSIDAAHDSVSSIGCIFLSKVLDRCWQRCAPDGAFKEYAKTLGVLIYCMKNIHFKNLSPAMFEVIASTLNSLAYYINIKDVTDSNSFWGRSIPAKELWDSEKKNIPQEYVEELKNYVNGSKWYMGDLQSILSF